MYDKNRVQSSDPYGCAQRVDEALGDIVVRCNSRVLLTIVMFTASILGLTGCELIQGVPTSTYDRLIAIAGMNNACQVLAAQEVEHSLGHNVTKVFDQTNKEGPFPILAKQDRWCRYEAGDDIVEILIIRDEASKRPIVDDIAAWQDCKIRTYRPNLYGTPEPLSPEFEPLLKQTFRQLWLTAWNLRQKCFPLEKVEEWKQMGAYVSLYLRTGRVEFPNDRFIFSILYSASTDLGSLKPADKDRIINITKDFAKAVLPQ